MQSKLKSYIPSKWEKTIVLNRHSNIRRYIPETALFTTHKTRQLLKRYKVMFIKPDTGSKGIGIVQALQQSSHHKQPFHLKWKTKKKSFRTAAHMFKQLDKQMTKRKYIVQKGVRLLERDGRPFDFRVMIQRNKDGKWEGSGVIGRLAQRNKIVTNGAQGASLHSIHELLEPYLTENEIDGYISFLYYLGTQASKQIRTAFPDVWEIGMDIGIDKNLKPWIIEVNTRPEYEPLSKLQDQTIYRRLLRNWKHARELGYKRYK